MSRKAYPTDITDAEWELLQPLIPPVKPGGRSRVVDMREIINAILYIRRSGCSWRLLPCDFPPWPTVYNYFRTWRRSGIWENINQALEEKIVGFPKKENK